MELKWNEFDKERRTKVDIENIKCTERKEECGSSERELMQKEVIRRMLVSLMQDQEVRVPLTSNLAEWDVEPAAFDATQVYSPACLAATDSMVNCFTRFPESDTITSIRSWFIGRPSNVQVISRGESPLVTTHCTETKSPALTGSSPKDIGAICGATVTRISKKRISTVTCAR